MSGAREPDLGEGWVAEDVRAEFPELRLRTLAVARGSGRTPPGARDRLRRLSDRFRGAQALALRRAPVPSAYRVFFRHVGLDPDTTRTPVEEAAVQRLLKGEFAPTNRLDDALLIALVETGVPLWALDADRVDGALGIAERGGRLRVVAGQRTVATLFAAVAAGTGVTPATQAMLLFAVQVPGVPAIFLEEAMWTALGVLCDEG